MSDFRVDSGDTVLKNYLETAKKTATYISKTVQNELMSVIGGYMQNKILHDILRGSEVFSVIAYESRDYSNQEQIPLIIRFIDEQLPPTN